jgi:phospholipid/cholesterol/gamma-HCH transport system substrate-binding protein
MLGAQRLLTDQLATDIHETLRATQRALRVVERVGDERTMVHAQGALRALERTANRLDSTIANPAIAQSISQLDELTENVTEMTEGLANATAALSAMLTQMGDTTGTIGRLVNSPTMHDELREVLVSMRRLLDDVRERPGRYVNVSVF